MSHLCAFDLIAWLPCHVSSSSSCVCVQGAVANAVGSQIINVFIGLGLPYAIAGSSLLDIHGVMTYLLCLLVCMLSFLVRTKNRAPFFPQFLPFVPSLSWQTIVFNRGNSPILSKWLLLCSDRSSVSLRCIMSCRPASVVSPTATIIAAASRSSPLNPHGSYAQSVRTHTLTQPRTHATTHSCNHALTH